MPAPSAVKATPDWSIWRYGSATRLARCRNASSSGAETKRSSSRTGPAPACWAWAIAACTRGHLHPGHADDPQLREVALGLAELPPGLQERVKALVVTQEAYEQDHSAELGDDRQLGGTVCPGS